MRRNELVGALWLASFRPFRLYLWDGGTFDIRHPEMLMVGQHAAVIGLVEQGRERRFGARISPNRAFRDGGSHARHADRRIAGPTGMRTTP